MSKFQFPDLSPEDEKIIKSYCKMMGYQSIIDKKNRIAKIRFENKSVYIVKIIYKGKIVLGTAKTSIDNNGNLKYEKFENLYVKYEEARRIQKMLPTLSGKVDIFVKAVFGLAYFLEPKLKHI